MAVFSVQVVGSSMSEVVQHEEAGSGRAVGEGELGVKAFVLQAEIIKKNNANSNIIFGEFTTHAHDIYGAGMFLDIRVSEGFKSS